MSSRPHSGTDQILRTAGPTASAATSGSASGAGQRSEPLQRAEDFIIHLRSQLAELDRREQNVNAQYTALEQERRRFRQTVQQQEEQLRQRELEVSRREEQAATQRTEWEAERQQLAASRDELDRERAAIQSSRATLQAEIAAEHAAERESLAAERRKLHAECEALTAQRETLEVERRSLAEERRELDQLEAGLEERRRQAEMELERHIEKERRDRTAKLERELEALHAQILEKRRWWDEEQLRAKEQFESEREDREQQLAALFEEFQEQQRQSQQQFDQREHELHQKQIDLEKRTRFHEAHLDQLRRTLEERHRELDAARQSAQTSDLQRDRLLRLRSQQLQRFRELLDHREDSLARERDLLSAARQSLQTLRNQLQSRANQEREAWLEECTAQRADFQRQQELLALHARNLDARRIRLDRLRDELEAAHRETLEMRLAVEQTWTQLCQNFGEETSRQRIEQVRANLVSHFDEVRAAIAAQREELVAVRERLERQRDEFRLERQQFSEWITERDEQLRAREANVQQEIDAAAVREEQWLATRDRWLQEKLEAESVIRQLLSELEVTTATSSPFDPQDETGEEDARFAAVASVPSRADGPESSPAAA